MLHLFVPLVLAQCCGPTLTDPCPCVVADWSVAFSCGCSTCPPGYYDIACSSACSCVDGLCLEGPSSSGACRCNLGAVGLQCEIEIPYVTGFLGLDECVSMAGFQRCDYPNKPFSMTIIGGKFNGQVSVDLVSITTDIVLQFNTSVISYNSTHIDVFVTPLLSRVPSGMYFYHV